MMTWYGLPFPQILISLFKKFWAGYSAVFSLGLGGGTVCTSLLCYVPHYSPPKSYAYLTTHLPNHMCTSLLTSHTLFSLYCLPLFNTLRLKCSSSASTTWVMSIKQNFLMLKWVWFRHAHMPRLVFHCSKILVRTLVFSILLFSDSYFCFSL